MRPTLAITGGRLAARRGGMPHSGLERRMSVQHLRPPWQPGQSGNPLGTNHSVFSPQG